MLQAGAAAQYWDRHGGQNAGEELAWPFPGAGAGIGFGLRAQAAGATRCVAGCRAQACVRREAPSLFSACTAQSQHFAGQKLRLGGDALGADPTYLLYLPFRSHGGI